MESTDLRLRARRHAHNCRQQPCSGRIDDATIANHSIECNAVTDAIEDALLDYRDSVTGHISKLATAADSQAYSARGVKARELSSVCFSMKALKEEIEKGTLR